MLKRLLIISSGGDAPGMNAAIRSTLRTAAYHGVEVWGCLGGYQGLIDRTIFRMSSDDVANCLQRGGTILQTARCELFLQKSARDQCRQYLKENQIDAIVVLGGDGSFRGASILESEGGPKTIGIPCTIDNDIVGTDYTIGFDTACNTALQAIDKIRDTAFSLNRNFLVEVMGRAAGFLAVEVGLAGGAEFILIPEIPTTVQQLVDRIQNKPRKKLASIIVVAEADQPGRVLTMAEEIKRLSGIVYKACVLGHTQRGGAPSVKDRKIAALMGNYAVEMLLQGKSKKMLAMRNNHLVDIDFPELSAGTRHFNNKELLKINDMICSVNV